MVALQLSSAGWVHETGMGHNEHHPLPSSPSLCLVWELSSCSPVPPLQVCPLQQKAMTRGRSRNRPALHPGGGNFVSSNVCERKLHRFSALLAPFLASCLSTDTTQVRKLPTSETPPFLSPSSSSRRPQVLQPMARASVAKLLGALGLPELPPSEPSVP